MEIQRLFLVVSFSSSALAFALRARISGFECAAPLNRLFCRFLVGVVLSAKIDQLPKFSRIVRNASVVLLYQ